MTKVDENSSTLMMTFAIVAYSLCSSTMLLANKMVTFYIGSTVVISLVQIVFATATIWGMKILKLEKVDDFTLEKAKAYMLFVMFFFSSMYTNIKALSKSNVETVIVFRSCTPIAICAIEYFFMGREFPSLRSSLSLLGVAVGAVMYCLSDSQLQLEGISSFGWVILYFCMISVDMTFGKAISNSVKMDSVWGSVYYCNALSILPFLVMGTYEGNFIDSIISIFWLDRKGLTVLLFSCVVGTFIGYTGWLCRMMLSATTYSLVGVINKFLTILLNVYLWDKHSTPFGTFAVCICLFSGIFYQQSPRRPDPVSSDLEEVQPLTQSTKESVQFLAKV